MSTILAGSKNFLEELGIDCSEKKIERLLIIEKIKNNPTFINIYAQRIHDTFNIRYEEISTYIRTELVSHGLPKHFLDKPLESRFKDVQQRERRLKITADLKMASDFEALMTQ